MRPSEVRTRVLAEHRMLRERLDALEAQADALLGGDAAALATLRAGLGDLLAALRSHVEAEESVLVPALEGADAWGPIRASQIREDHVTQLRTLASWDRAARDDGLPPADLAARVRRFVGGLRADMEAEERDLLHPDLLRDDVVVVSQASS